MGDTMLRKKGDHYDVNCSPAVQRMHLALSTLHLNEHPTVPRVQLRDGTCAQCMRLESTTQLQISDRNSDSKNNSPLKSRHPFRLCPILRAL